MKHDIEGRRRWFALVALPSIRSDLGFSETSLVWVKRQLSAIPRRHIAE
jgi:hypothetical protein